MSEPLQNPNVAEKFESYAPATRQQVLALRRLVLEAAAATPGVGRIEETLKWGQPSYLTPETGSGTTVRIDAYPGGGVAMFVNCQTDLVETYRSLYPELEYEGVRAIVMRDGVMDEAALRHCVALALTYHKRKRE